MSFLRDRSPVTPKITRLDGPAIRGSRWSPSVVPASSRTGALLRAPLHILVSRGRSRRPGSVIVTGRTRAGPHPAGKTQGGKGTGRAPAILRAPGRSDAAFSDH